MGKSGPSIEWLWTEIRKGPYRASIGISLAVVAWGWLTTAVAIGRPPLIGFVLVASVPYLAWTYVPIKVVQALDITLAPGLLPTPTLPMVHGEHLSPGEWVRQITGSVLVALVGGILYALLTKPFRLRGRSRFFVLRQWMLSLSLAILVTSFYLLVDYLAEIWGGTEPFQMIQNVTRAITWLPFRAVSYIVQSEPRIYQLGDFELRPMLEATGLATLLMAVVAFMLLRLLPKVRRGQSRREATADM